MRVFKVKGISMLPLIQNGDRVITRPFEQYQKDDVIVYNYKKEGILVHRIVGISTNSYICRGDNAVRLERVKKEEIIGKVIYILKKDS